MTDYFFDSSALAKLYHNEVGSQRVDSIERSPGSRISIARLAIVEVRSSFGIKVRNRQISRSDDVRLLEIFGLDLISKRFHVGRVSDSDFDTAGDLLQRYAFDHRRRALDALQLAVALKLKRSGNLDYFVAADKVLCDVAALEGMALINPDVP